jgi:hypothetical protein
MWLRYGVDTNNTLVAIEDTRSGKTNSTSKFWVDGVKKG